MRCHLFPFSSSFFLFFSFFAFFPPSQGAKHWKASIHAETPAEIFPRDRLIYLSPDAEEPLTDFEKDKVGLMMMISTRVL
jgi:hypothetical protein